MNKHGMKWKNWAYSLGILTYLRCVGDLLVLASWNGFFFGLAQQPGLGYSAESAWVIHLWKRGWAIQSDLTLNGGLFRKEYQNGCKWGIENILKYPESGMLLKTGSKGA